MEMPYKIGKSLIKNRKLILKTDGRINFGTKKGSFVTITHNQRRTLKLVCKADVNGQKPFSDKDIKKLLIYNLS